jgi:hypothetical protein
MPKSNAFTELREALAYLVYHYVRLVRSIIADM